MDVAVQDSTEVDIYADLPTFKYDETLDQLKKSEAQLLYNNGKLQTLVEEKACEIDQLKIKIRNLELNISSLLKTARSEISRKDKTISDLRAQICELRRSSVSVSPRTLSNHRERLKLDRTPKKPETRLRSVRRDLSQDEFPGATLALPSTNVDPKKPSPLTSVNSEQTKCTANVPLKAPVPTILQPNVPVRTLFSARALQRIRAEDSAKNASPPTAPSKELEASRSGEAAQAPTKEPESPQNECLEPISEESRVIKPTEVGHVSDESKKVPPGVSTAENGEGELSGPPPSSSVVVHSSYSTKDLSGKTSGLDSNNEMNTKPSEVQPQSVHLEGAEKVSSTKLAPKKISAKASQLEKPAVKSPKPPEHSHFTRLRSRTRPQINVSPISSVWSQKSKRTCVKITKADPPKKPETLDVSRSTKPSVVDLFGSPVKWTENSSDVVPFDITSPAVFEDSVITQTDCVERPSPTVPFSNPLNESNIAATQSFARKSHFLRDEPTLAEPASTNFESTTQFVSALTKTYTQISPLKSPRSSNSLPLENNPDKASSIQLRNFSHESLRPESTSQPVPSLTTISSPISEPKSPVAPKSPARKEAATKNSPAVSAEPSKLGSPPATSSIFNLQSQSSINIFSKNLTTKRDFSDKPINILQPRKTPRIIGTTKSCPSSSFPAKPSSSLSTPSEPIAAKIAISESFISEQEKRVRHWQKEKLFCHSFSVGEGSTRQASEVHHMTEVVYSPRMLTSSQTPIAPPARSKARVEEATGPTPGKRRVATPIPVSNCPEIIVEKPKQMPSTSAVSPKPVIEGNEVLSKASLTSLKPSPRTSNFKRSSALKITPKAADGSGDQRTRFEIMADTRVDTLYKPRRIENYSTNYHDKRSSREHNLKHASYMKDRSAGNASPQEKRDPKVSPKPRESPVTLPSTKLVVRPRKTVQLQSTTPSSTVHFTYGNEYKPATLSTTPVSTSRSSALQVSVTVTDFLEPSPVSRSPRLKTPSQPNHAVPMASTSQQNGEEKVRTITTPMLRGLKRRKINLSCVTQSTPHKVFVYGKDS